MDSSQRQIDGLKHKLLAHRYTFLDQVCARCVVCVQGCIEFEQKENCARHEGRLGRKVSPFSVRDLTILYLQLMIKYLIPDLIQVHTRKLIGLERRRRTTSMKHQLHLRLGRKRVQP